MAKFKDRAVPSGTSPQTAWKMLKDALLEAESVEALVRFDDDDNPVEIVLRLWDAERRDGSNDLEAAPGNY